MLGWRAVPLRLAATLAAGLPEESRSILKLSGQKVPLSTRLQAEAVDTLHVLEWRMRDCRGRPPKSVLGALLGHDDAPASDVQSFDNPEEFDAAMAALEGG